MGFLFNMSSFDFYSVGFRPIQAPIGPIWAHITLNVGHMGPSVHICARPGLFVKANPFMKVVFLFESYISKYMLCVLFFS